MTRSRWPTTVLLLAAASLAFGPRFVLPVIAPGYVAAWWEPLQHGLLLLGLLCNFLVHGRHRGIIPWPVLVVSLLLILSPVVTAVSLPQLPAGTRAGYALAAWMVLALPWLTTVPRLEAGSAGRYAAILASLALLSAVLGLVLQLGTEWYAYGLRDGTLYRFRGATRGDYFAGLAFGGVLIAVHEWNRRRSRVIGALATINAILLILSGSRTPLIVLGAWFGFYLTMAPGLRRRMFGNRSGTWLGLGPVAVAFLLYFPVLRTRMSGLAAGELDLSGRPPIWATFFDHFQSHPWTGMGLGAAQPGVLHQLLPHNEFLRLLVGGGVIGSVLYLGSILPWIRRVWTRLEVEDRPFLLALMLALPLYSMTDNPVSACYILPFIYLGALMPGRDDIPTS